MQHQRRPAAPDSTSGAGAELCMYFTLDRQRAHDRDPLQMPALTRRLRTQGGTRMCQHRGQRPTRGSHVISEKRAMQVHWPHARSLRAHPPAQRLHMAHLQD